MNKILKNLNHKTFGPTNWSINNSTSILIITLLVTAFGLMNYTSLPKNQFPDIVIPTMVISTIYPGTSPADMENLVTRPIEKQLKSLSGVKKITSNSIQDFSIVTIEFNTDVDVADAKQKVKDAVDKSKTDLPNDLPSPPNVLEVDFSEMPIRSVNVSGDFDLNKLKKYADRLQDEIEGLREITRADMAGALDREIQINVDMFKMQAASVAFSDIERAVAFENMTISGGLVNVDNMKRALQVKGQFKNADILNDIVIKTTAGGVVHLKDIAEIKDTYKEKESYARYNGKNVITLSVIKRSGENLIDASDKIRLIIEKLKTEEFPKSLDVSISGDMSKNTRTTLHDLNNSIIIGFILVVLVLMFFMGVTNAFFVALSVPLSCFVAFMIMPFIDFELNMIVMFGLLFALGIIVDDAIVVIENTYRIYNHGEVPIKEAAKQAAGEVFVPVLAGTLTTLAPFIPLTFWQGIVGKFMFYLPITLILTLLASLVVAYIINPVFAVWFMRPDAPTDTPEKRRKLLKSRLITAAVLLVLALFGHLANSPGIRNFMLISLAIFVLYFVILKRLISGFEHKLLPRFMDAYERVMGWLMRGILRPILVIVAIIMILIGSVTYFSANTPPSSFFPQGEPNFIYAYLVLPVGTNAAYTDSITQIVENRIFEVVGKNNPIVESVIANVAVSATDPQSGDRTTASNKGRVSVAFVEFAKRNGESTAKYLDLIRQKVQGIPGLQIAIAQEGSGPPTGAPINIEIAGENLDNLQLTAARLKAYLQDTVQVPGIEELKSDFVNNNPEVIVEIDRERAAREGISTAQIGSEIRTAVFGKEVSKLKDDEDEYPIELRYTFNQRNDLQQLLNLKITFRDMNMGGLVRQVPLSAVADIKYTNTYGGIKRKNLERVITLQSNVLGGYFANNVNGDIKRAITNFNLPDGIKIDMTGEQEEQAETVAFLGRSLLISLLLIILILVTQFNSLSKSFIILTEVIFSIIGVLLGFSFFQMSMAVVMVGIGVIGLAGIVVRNGILIVEFADVLKNQGHDSWYSVVHAGKTRLKPVLLTATATMLGLVPLAVGMNIDFASMFTHLDPKIFFGGDSVAFWGPLSWTIIFGLAFATIITLVVVPAMYLLNDKLHDAWHRWRGTGKFAPQTEQGQQQTDEPATENTSLATNL